MLKFLIPIWFPNLCNMWRDSFLDGCPFRNTICCWFITISVAYSIENTRNFTKNFYLFLIKLINIAFSFFGTGFLYNRTHYLKVIWLLILIEINRSNLFVLCITIHLQLQTFIPDWHENGTFWCKEFILFCLGSMVLVWDETYIKQNYHFLKPT